MRQNHAIGFKEREQLYGKLTHKNESTCGLHYTEGSFIQPVGRYISTKMLRWDIDGGVEFQ